ncbi:tRNA (adenosine(37)-N6)-threonylcarbamoyltransferase complex ATPase subunit type 1 TsaE [Tateyamaria omphalii]|uniref:tRNA (adenosine(37)-N6)-threonylcarbamoyltransferase complex ATPase subunit type 1 TsaE n=1 Tax=Tateyamaria omphalii TaxID=299262 RepID=UPI001674AB41|nr:tRNA (adenosine(37)-N6)-threonylcarbamoyltransferase complex ATPase subunit type 1 TsaE [Tateyamaria omphalii]GGX39701.1 tRNA (adenosine(37)-N6)-threonylcarbamoyltransferase complex ATPase subunit type 1 TsaE [Tateyamaria omphalii]
MTSAALTLHWPTAAETTRAGTTLGPCLRAGDVVLLEGDVGAGKTQFARALIQSVLLEPEDVPSPTFTLVQVYETENGTLWHADLYRISADTEIDELGLSEAFEDAICLVEWPDRLGPLTPESALTIKMKPDGAGRSATLHWTDPRWPDRLEQVVANA